MLFWWEPNYTLQIDVNWAGFTHQFIMLYLYHFHQFYYQKNRVLGTWRRLMQRAHSSCYVTISSHVIFSLNYICCFHYRQLPEGGYFESPSSHTYFDLFMLWRNLSFLKANQPPTGKSRMSPVQLTFRREILIIHYRWVI